MVAPRRSLVALSLVRSHRAEGVDVGALSEALRLFELEEVGRGRVLYHQDDPADELQILVDGLVKVCVAPADRQVAVIQAPAIIGHLGVLTGLPRSATVTAGGPVTLGRMSEQEFWRLMQDGSAPAVALRRLLLASLVGLLECTNAQVAEEVAARGEPISPVDAAAARPARPTPRARARAQDLGASDSWGFDRDLLQQVEEVKFVRSDADKKRTFKP